MRIAARTANLKPASRTFGRGAGPLAARPLQHYDTPVLKVLKRSLIMHHRRGLRWLPHALAAGLLLGWLAPMTYAAEGDAEKPFEEPGITYMQRADNYIQWIAGSLFIAACVLIAFKNPHRSHLD